MNHLMLSGMDCVPLVQSSQWQKTVSSPEAHATGTRRIREPSTGLSVSRETMHVVPPNSSRVGRSRALLSTSGPVENPVDNFGENPVHTDWSIGDELPRPLPTESRYTSRRRDRRVLHAPPTSHAGVSRQARRVSVKIAQFAPFRRRFPYFCIQNAAQPPPLRMRIDALTGAPVALARGAEGPDKPVFTMPSRRLWKRLWISLCTISWLR